ncbi:hypothetical protein FRC12_003456 [Ceratobasidium sp. 428]|nr:hypothetical protein FRC12_003456 [Ceratobasidium sp. 428]
MRAFAEELWNDSQKIILGIDIGATQSAVSFAYLYPGGPQTLHRVANWPGQESHKGESKIPTLVYYDSDGKAVSFGAEAAKVTTGDAEDQGWRLVRHFKLHLHPKTMQQKYDLKVQPLPDGIPLEKIYADFMAYILQHTRSYFESRVLEGANLWKELRDDMTIVLAHPNGWAIKEQNFLRKAAIAAKYTTEDKAHTQIHFVSEAEASMHFCMFHSDIHRRLEPGVGLIVCDAGGSTIDTTAYRVKSTSPVLKLEEVKASACVQAGGVFVDLKCENHLRSVLSKIELDEEERNDYVQNGIKDFETSTKRLFGSKDTDGAALLEYRVNMQCRLQQPEHKIRRGVITLPSEMVQGFFGSCVTETAECVRRQMSGFDPKTGSTLQHILLVGGFGDSPYLRQKLLSEFNNAGCSVTIANDLTSKAVADGAVIWSAKLSVVKRVTRVSYGTGICAFHNSQNPDHAGRTILKWKDGSNRVWGYWSQIVGRGVVMDTTGAIRQSYRKQFKEPNPQMNKVSDAVYAWTNDSEPPNEWLCDKRGHLNRGYERICEVEADLSGMSRALEKRSGPKGDYYRLEYTIALQFGGTELRAFLEWKQAGKTHTGPASIIPSALTVVQS